jgi:hypothetical protein
MNVNDVNDVNDEKVTSSNDDNDLNNELSDMNIDSRVKKYNCLFCLKEVSTTLRCSKCRTALYCGRACQEKHWPVHKNICLDSNNAENSIEKLEMKAQNHLKQGD